MKRTIIAAATLLLGTSALTAASAAQDKYDKEAFLVSKLVTAAIPAGDGVEATKLARAAAMKGPARSGTAAAIADKSAMAVKFVETDPVVLAKYEQAAALKAALATGGGGPLEEVDEAAVPAKTAFAGKFVETDPIVISKYEQAAAMKSAQASTGMGGPLEDLAPRPAADNYPPCNPGPGDDRCIQLYEPGVRAQLASWNEASGGLADGSVTTAMGGPFEPLDASYAAKGDGLVDGSAATAMGGPFEPLDEHSNDIALAMNGDGVVDGDLGETVDMGGDAALAGHDEFSGVGGPIEAQSGYPPCSPGPGDDRCIQLYEPGVTGAGN